MIRLYTENDLFENAEFSLCENQHHYLKNVMRLKEKETVLLFNGKDGEWEASIQTQTKKETTVFCTRRTRPQTDENLADIWLCFAPIKKTEIIIQKATELGVKTLIPVITERTVISKVHPEKMKAQAIEASEQSERLSVPEIKEAISLDTLLNTQNKERLYYFLNERGEGNKIDVTSSKQAFIVGPEGGFTPKEIEKMQAAKVIPLHLGRLILRAETACIAILSYIQIDRALKKDCKMSQNALNKKNNT